MMVKYETTKLEKEARNRRRTDGQFMVILHLVGLAFYLKFGKALIITCLGRNYNPKSAHCINDKFGCGADIKSWEDGSDPYLTVEELTWLANLNLLFGRYFDMIVEDERITGKKPPGGNHVHFEKNPGWWVNF